MAEAVVARPAVTPEIVELEPLHAAVEHVGGAAADVPSLLGGAFTLTMGEIQASGAQVAGPPFARYLSFGERIEAEVGFPYIGTLVPTERVHDTVLPGGRAVLTTHVGSYEDIGAVWEAIGAWIQEHGLEVASPPWESYLSGPDDPGLPVTRIVFPIR